MNVKVVNSSIRSLKPQTALLRYPPFMFRTGMIITHIDEIIHDVQNGVYGLSDDEVIHDVQNAVYASENSGKDV